MDRDAKTKAYLLRGTLWHCLFVEETGWHLGSVREAERWTRHGFGLEMDP